MLLMPEEALDEKDYALLPAQALSDHVEIAQLVQRYGNALDEFIKQFVTEQLTKEEDNE
jgi:hypothetical protein